MVRSLPETPQVDLHDGLMSLRDCMFVNRKPRETPEIGGMRAETSHLQPQELHYHRLILNTRLL